MELFLQPNDVFEKVATTRMPEDPNAWPQEILQQLFKEVPYMSDFSPHVVMDKVDAEKGYAFGHVTVMNQSETQLSATPEAQQAAGLRQVRIPIVIKDGELSPLDLLITDDSRVLPLTESRLRAAIFRPQAFDVTSKTPGDQSMIGQLYPPFRQNFGFAGGGGVTMNADAGASSKMGSVLEEYLTKEALQLRNTRTGEIIDTTSKDRAATAKVTARHGVSGAVLGGLGGLAGSATGLLTHKPLRAAAIGAAAGGALGAAHGHGGARGAIAMRDFTARQIAQQRAVREAQEAGTKQAFSKAALKLDYKPDGSLTLDSEEDKKHPAPEVTGDMEEAPVTMAEQQSPVDTMNAVGGTPEVKTGSMLRAIAHTMNEADIHAFRGALSDRDVRLAYEKNASVVYPSLEVLFSRFNQPKHKLASAMHELLRPSVVQLIKMGSGYQLRTANPVCWAPQSMMLTRGEALQKFGSDPVMAADTSGSATMSDTDGVAEAPPEPGVGSQQAEPVAEFGLYKVETTEGHELTGYVIPNLIDIDGMPAPVALFTNGMASAIQGEILGSPAEEDGTNLPTGDAPNGYGVFADLNSGEVVATIPLRLHGSFESEGQPAVFSGETYDGRPIEVSVQPNIQVITATGEGRMLVPDHWQWIPLGETEAVALLSHEGEASKQAEAQRSYASVEVASSGETFSFRGHALSKLASDQTQFLDVDGAMFLLAGLGVNQDYGISKLAEAITGRAPAVIRIGRYIKLAEDRAKEASAEAQEIMSRMPQLRRPLFKEAGFITDPEAVDTVLSLGFINPENVTTFIGYLPTIEKTQESLCNLLFATRVGLSDVPESALETSVRATEEVLEGLKTIAFQGPALHS